MEIGDLAQSPIPNPHTDKLYKLVIYLNLIQFTLKLILNFKFQF